MLKKLGILFILVGGAHFGWRALDRQLLVTSWMGDKADLGAGIIAGVGVVLLALGLLTGRKAEKK